MTNAYASVLCLAIVAMASGAVADPSAPAPAPSVSGVTVQAAPKPQVIQRQAQSFVQAYASPTAALDQIARWRAAVCVQVMGLPKDLAVRVSGRIEQVARAVDLSVGRPGCAPDIEILFAADPQKVMDAVAERREALLGYYHRHEAAKLKVVSRPIQAWYVTATEGGGNAAGAVFNQGNAIIPIPHKTEVVDDPDNPSPSGCSDNPRFTSCRRGVFRNVLAVVDVKALEGRDLGLVTDYLVMLTLSQPRSLDGCNALASVLDVLAPGRCPGRETPPDGLTPADAAYLTSLYAADLEAKKAGEEGEISQRMARILVKASAAKP